MILNTFTCVLDIGEKKKRCNELQRILDEPPVSEAELTALQQSVRELTTDLNALLERRNAQLNPAHDKLAIFRQQATLIGRKKEAAAETLRRAQEELSAVGRVESSK